MICYTVSDVNKFIKGIFSYEEIFYGISVKGEISNFVCHKSGHMYFTLKDGKSSIKCVMFNEYADKVTFLPQNGMSVIVTGNVGVYERDGIYQIYVVNIAEDGCGSIKKDLDDLTLKLMNEGLFDSDKKRPIPEMPKIIGVITAPGSAALQDIINILSRRMPTLSVRVYPALVQGRDSVDSILSAIKTASIDSPDVLIIGRGGGSVEDLSVFNDESILREVYKLKIPVISAVGHETDRYLLDLVSDLRAPTPSAAAELVCLDVREIKNQLNYIMERINICMKNIFNRYDVAFCDFKHKLNYLSPYSYILGLNDRLNQLLEKLNFAVHDVLKQNYDNLKKNKILLDSLNPVRVLRRGYSIVVDDNNSIVSSVDDIQLGEVFRIKMYDGECVLKAVEKL